MLNEDEIQNDLLDRLVDGELPDGDYCTLIHRLDDSPDGWRRCALSFLEQQALQRDLKQMLKEGQRFDPLGDAVLDHDGKSNGAPRVTTQDRWERWLGQPWVRWTSVLAVGILAFIGGLALQPFGSTDRPIDRRVADASPNNSNSVLRSQAFPASDNPRTDAATLFIENSHAGPPRPVQVQARPIRYRDDFAIPKFAPDRLSQRFINAIGGSSVPNRIERRVFFLRTPDGNVFILPVDIIMQDSSFQ